MNSTAGLELYEIVFAILFLCIRTGTGVRVPAKGDMLDALRARRAARHPRPSAWSSSSPTSGSRRSGSSGRRGSSAVAEKLAAAASRRRRGRGARSRKGARPRWTGLSANLLCRMYSGITFSQMSSASSPHIILRCALHLCLLVRHVFMCWSFAMASFWSCSSLGSAGPSPRRRSCRSRRRRRRTPLPEVVEVPLAAGRHRAARAARRARGEPPTW